MEGKRLDVERIDFEEFEPALDGSSVSDIGLKPIDGCAI
jgi:hypothetical protein